MHFRRAAVTDRSLKANVLARRYTHLHVALPAAAIGAGRRTGGAVLQLRPVAVSLDGPAPFSPISEASPGIPEGRKRDRVTVGISGTAAASANSVLLGNRHRRRIRRSAPPKSRVREVGRAVHQLPVAYDGIAIACIRRRVGGHDHRRRAENIWAPDRRPRSPMEPGPQGGRTARCTCSAGGDSGTSITSRGDHGKAKASAATSVQRRRQRAGKGISND